MSGVRWVDRHRGGAPFARSRRRPVICTQQMTGLFRVSGGGALNVRTPAPGVDRVGAGARVPGRQLRIAAGERVAGAATGVGRHRTPWSVPRGTDRRGTFVGSGAVCFPSGARQTPRRGGSGAPGGVEEGDGRGVGGGCSPGGVLGGGGEVVDEGGADGCGGGQAEAGGDAAQAARAAPLRGLGGAVLPVAHGGSLRFSVVDGAITGRLARFSFPGPAANPLAT